MLRRARAGAAGFTLIEMAVVVGILGIALMVAIPNYRAWTMNAQVRAAAESMVDGLRMARTEAVRHNLPVRFQLMTSGCALSNTGMYWVVSRSNATGHCSDTPSDSVSPFIVRTNDMTKQFPKVTVSSYLVDTNFVATATGINTLTFTALGTVNEALQGGEWIDFTTTGLSGSDTPRKLRITVTQSGQIRMCDPAVTDTTDPRRCFQGQ